MYNHFQNAEHNEQTSRYLAESPEYADWVIITSFYGALHVVRHLMQVELSEGEALQTFDELYQKRTDHSKNGHDFEMKFIVKHHPEIQKDYFNLHKMSIEARYKLVQHTLQQALEAQKHAETIKRYVLRKSRELAK